MSKKKKVQLKVMSWRWKTVFTDSFQKRTFARNSNIVKKNTSLDINVYCIRLNIYLININISFTKVSIKIRIVWLVVWLPQVQFWGAGKSHSGNFHHFVITILINGPFRVSWQGWKCLDSLSPIFSHIKIYYAFIKTCCNPTEIYFIDIPHIAYLSNVRV